MGQFTTGKARAVLVSPAPGQPVAIVTTVWARLLPRGRGPRLVTAGSVRFTPETQQHLHDVVLPAVDQITGALGMPQRRFELSIVNLAAASVQDVGLEVDGFSLDTAAALAMLSSTLRLPIRQDVVSTGQIASMAGDIRPVHSLPAKLQAACTTPGIVEFICPALVEDRSLELLTPSLLKEAVDAIATASTWIRVTQIRGLAELLRHATTDEERLHAALAGSYFDRIPEGPPTATVLVDGLEDVFWQYLETHLNAGGTSQVRRLLESRMRHELKRHRYPTGFGSRLMALIQSISPVIRRKRRFFPLLPTTTCFQAGCLARAGDQADAAQLLCAATGRLGRAVCIVQDQPSQPPVSPRAGHSLDATLDAISAETLAREIGIPADEARAGFVLPGVIIEDYDLFNDTITAFHLALLRHTDGNDAVPQPDEALSLLERTYADQGGLAAARAEGMYGVEGGMRTILDRSTEQYKMEQRYKRVNRVLKEALDPLDWDRQLEFTKSLLERLRPDLSGKLNDADPRRFVRRRDEIVRAYVQGLDRLQSLMRTL